MDDTAASPRRVDRSRAGPADAARRRSPGDDARPSLWVRSKSLRRQESAVESLATKRSNPSVTAVAPTPRSSTSASASSSSSENVAPSTISSSRAFNDVGASPVSLE